MTIKVLGVYSNTNTVCLGDLLKYKYIHDNSAIYGTDA
jgi:hypothetical protein